MIKFKLLICASCFFFASASTLAPAAGGPEKTYENRSEGVVSIRYKDLPPSLENPAAVSFLYLPVIFRTSPPPPSEIVVVLFDNFLLFTP